jgi:hypothetical protein
MPRPPGAAFAHDYVCLHDAKACKRQNSRVVRARLQKNVINARRSTGLTRYTPPHSSASMQMGLGVNVPRMMALPPPSARLARSRAPL